MGNEKAEGLLGLLEGKMGSGEMQDTPVFNHAVEFCIASQNKGPGLKQPLFSPTSIIITQKPKGGMKKLSFKNLETSYFNYFQST